MRQPPPHGPIPPQYPGLVPGPPGGPLRGGSAIATARAAATARRQSMAVRGRGTSAQTSPSAPFRGPRPPTVLPIASGPPPAVPQAAASAAAPAVTFAPAQGAVPGAPPEDVGTGTLQDFEAQMLVEQALYELTQKPIIPNSLVFTCAACYLIFIGFALVSGSVFFTYRLKPATPPDPPEQTDTTVTFFEGLTKATTQSPKNWEVNS
ncbi:uncharacterized protein LOC142802980 [Rhipicephalus microplus]|uniref:uncharacterized protein LOC142802980 n=1 Tax=Rhipicephalus microplus TaxID=6941 RepID=UPI003F6C366C